MNRKLCMLLACLSFASAHAALAARDAPLQSVRAFAWLGGWERLHTPSVPAPADSKVEGTLGNAFRVEWHKNGQAFRVKITRLEDGWAGRLGVEFRFAPGTESLAYGFNELPVRLPLQGTKSGQLVWFWDVGTPGWILAERGREQSRVRIATRNHHGFFLAKDSEGFSAQVCLDAPAHQGGSVEMGFQAGAGIPLPSRSAYPVPKQREWEAARRLGNEGFVRVDAAGSGFVTAKGTPFYPFGNNQPYLITLSGAEQNRILKQMAASGMNTVRVLVSDYWFAPLPGVWNEEAYRRLRGTVELCRDRGIRVIVCLELSAYGYQYSRSSHLSASPGDLYVMKEPLAWYRETVRRVVKPLKNHPAVLAWDVTNEPSLEPDPASAALKEGFREWLLRRYGAVESLRAAWGDSSVNFEAAEMPDKKSYQGQSTRPAQDFFAYANTLLADSLIARARMVRQADPKHLITLSHGNPRLLRGRAGADVYDYWSPHTYDLWINGPEISHHVLLLVESLRRALPGRPRPVVIEEFGISEGADFPEAMRAEHIRQFIEAGQRWGAGGILHWWEMTPLMYRMYADAVPYRPPLPAKGIPLSVYLPYSEEWNLMEYNRYMTRRLWAKTLATAVEAGYVIRFVGSPAEAKGSQALLILGDALSPAELSEVKEAGLKILILPGSALQKDLPEADAFTGEKP